MANYTPTCSEYSIDVPAPKDAEGRRVLLDTKVMYNDAGVEYMVSGFVFDTSKLAAGWDVKCFTPSDDIEVIKRYLADHDLTQKQLAQMAGITPGTLSALIRFQRDMRVGNLFALADAMRMDPRNLVEKIEEDE